MAVLGIAAAGAAATSVVGIGWQAGWIAGAMIGMHLFGTGAKVKGTHTVSEGPRLGDTKISVSSYGDTIPLGYGTLRQAGNMIWTSGIREQKNTTTTTTRTRAGGKGGGGKKITSTHTEVTYSYFASFALGLGEGPADAPLRIWADGKLIHDKTGAKPEVSIPGLNVRFYPGDETQLPDPLIEANVGAGLAPAHRGLAYLVFEELPLADFGNRIPNITVEMTFAGTDTTPYVLWDPIEGGIDGWQIDTIGVDWRRGYAYVIDALGDADSAGVRRINIRTMVEDRQARMSEVLVNDLPEWRPHTLTCGSDGALYMQVGGGNSGPIIRVDPNALREVARFGDRSNGLSNTHERFVRTADIAEVAARVSGGLVRFCLTRSIFDDVGLLNAETMGYVWGSGQTVDESRASSVCGGLVGEGYGQGYVLGSNTGPSHTAVSLYRMTVNAALQEDAGVSFDKVLSLSPSDVQAGATAFFDTARALAYDQTDDGVMFQATIVGSPNTDYVIKWRADVGIVWRTAVGIRMNRAQGFHASRLVSHTSAYIRDNTIFQIDTASGAMLLDEEWPSDAREDGVQAYDAASDSIIRINRDDVARLYLNRSSGDGETLGAIVADLCDRAGLALTDIDVAELTETVPGYVIARQTTVRSAIEVLASGYFFDAAESDDVLAFRVRGRAPAASATHGWLVMPEGGSESGETLKETRAQEVELPERVSVLYMDKDLDYQQGTQMARRVALPLPTMHSREQVSMELPFALQATAAKRIATKTLYSAWMERAGYEVTLPPAFLRLDPTDVLTIEIPGATFEARLNRVDVGAGFAVSVQGASQAAATYTSTVEADTGLGVGAGAVATQIATRLLVPDLPLLRDTDDVGGIGSRVYCMAGGYGPGWPGAAIYSSADGASWSNNGRVLSGMTWGAAANALGEPDDIFSTDEINTLTVFLTEDTDALESVAQETMVNGANAALLLKANGEPEIIQFRDVMPNDDGSYTLCGLLRGRRGTDPFVSGHATGDAFVLLDADDAVPMVVPLDDLGVPRTWRAVSFNAIFENGDTESFTHTGRDLMPYAPVHIAGSRDVADDLTITWTRRTRIGGALKDATGTVPLAEDSEAYEVDILDAPGGSVVRTISGLTSESATYSAADQTTDLGAPQATVHVAVHQISATIGRGFPGTASV